MKKQFQNENYKLLCVNQHTSGILTSYFFHMIDKII